MCKLRVSFRSFCVFNISTVKRTHFVAVHVRKPAALSTCHITRFRLSERNYEALFDLKQTDCSVFQAAERRTQAPAGRNMQAERWRLTHLRPKASGTHMRPSYSTATSALATVQLAATLLASIHATGQPQYSRKAAYTSSS